MILIGNLNFHLKSKNPGNLFKLRTSTDFIIKIEDYDFHVHREVLASNSKAFNSFLEHNILNVVKIDGVSPKIMKIILNFMYTNELEMNCQNIVDIFTAAQKLKMKKIVIKCIQVLRRKDSKSLVYLYAICWKLDLKIEKFISLDAILKNVKSCLKGEEYLDLNIDQICEIITEGYVNSEKYSHKNGFLLFMMCVNWIDHRREDRMQHVIRLMSCVQFRKMRREEIMQCCSRFSANFITQLPRVKNMLFSALYSIAAKEVDDSENC